LIAMSEFIRLLNQIKTHRTEAWLTPSQVEAMTALQRALRIPGVVNLLGHVGVGKTFLGWSIADKMSYRYIPHIEQINDLQDMAIEGLVVDNCLPDRTAHRDVRKQLSFQNIRYAVVITRRMIDDYIPYVELKLADQDWYKVMENLGSIGAFRERASVTDLWQLLNPHLLQGV